MKIQHFILLSILLFMAFAAHAGSVVELTVDGDVAIFKTSDTKNNVAISCVTAANKAYWTVNLKTDSGRAAYSSLITAMGLKANVHVSSAEACSHKPGFEAADVVTISDMANDNAVEFVGYTRPTHGDMHEYYNYYNKQSGFQQSPARVLAFLCNKQYPGSRVMKWHDYEQLINTYDHTQEIWFPDAVEKVYIDSNGTENIQFKNLQKIDRSRGSFPRFNSEFTPSCNGYSSRSNSVYGIKMNWQGLFSIQSCETKLRLACVR